MNVSLALVILHAICIRRIMLSPVACLVVPYFPYCLINGTIFEKKTLKSVF